MSKWRKFWYSCLAIFLAGFMASLIVDARGPHDRVAIQQLAFWLQIPPLILIWTRKGPTVRA